MMKKTFNLTSETRTPERQVDLVKHEIKKYISRELRKPKPTNVDFWDFDCKFGDDLASCATIHVSEINKKIDEITKRSLISFYVEILSKPGIRSTGIQQKR
jgi:hypothetical protein